MAVPPPPRGPGQAVVLQTNFSPRVRESGFREIQFACGIQNPGLWKTLRTGIRHEEFAIPLTIRIRNPSPTEKDRNPEPGIWNQQRGIQNPRSSLIALHGALLISAVSCRCFGV